MMISVSRGRNTSCRVQKNASVLFFNLTYFCPIKVLKNSRYHVALISLAGDPNKFLQNFVGDPFYKYFIISTV